MEETRKPTRKPRPTTAAKTATRAAPAKTAAKTAAKPAAARTPMTAGKVTAARPAPAVPTPHEREQRVRTAAYFRAERRGFMPGNEWDDWLAAEAEVGSLPAQNGTPKPRKTPARKKPAG
jgi:hypothetical protein